jgi:hypothetical protein
VRALRAKQAESAQALVQAESDLELYVAEAQRVKAQVGPLPERQVEDPAVIEARKQEAALMDELYETLNAREVELNERAAALEARETELNERALALEAREAERRGEEETAAAAAAQSTALMDELYETLTAREGELDERERSLEAREASTAVDAAMLASRVAAERVSRTSTHDSTAANAEEVQMELEARRAVLEQEQRTQREAWEAEVARMQVRLHFSAALSMRGERAALEPSELHETVWRANKSAWRRRCDVANLDWVWQATMQAAEETLSQQMALAAEREQDLDAREALLERALQRQKASAATAAAPAAPAEAADGSDTPRPGGIVQTTAADAPSTESVMDPKLTELLQSRLKASLIREAAAMQQLQVIPIPH